MRLYDTLWDTHSFTTIPGGPLTDRGEHAGRETLVKRWLHLIQVKGDTVLENNHSSPASKMCDVSQSVRKHVMHCT